MTVVDEAVTTADTPLELPPKPRPSLFMLGLWVAMAIFTVLCARRVGFSFAGIIEDLQRPNPVLDGLWNIRWGEMFSERSRKAFLETLQLAVLGTTAGVIVSLPFALFTTRVGNPYAVPRIILRSLSNVIRAIPERVFKKLSL